MYEYNATVTRVVDGDTIVVCVDLGMKVSIDIMLRLNNIDTPEIRRASNIDEKMHGYEAKTYVEDLLLDKKVVIRTFKDKTGKYGRYIADVYINGDSVVDLLIENGFEKKESY